MNLRAILCLCLASTANALLLGHAAPAPSFAASTMPRMPAVMAAAATIDAKTVKKLRDSTGAGMMDCKKALVDADGDVEAATEALRKKGLASAEKKASRKASEGVIETYIHTGSKLGVMVEVNCETDFVAKRPEFQELAKAIAMQIAACPTVEVVSEADIDDDFIEREKKIEAQSEDLQGKPAEIVDKIVTGRVAKLVKTKLLLEQPYIRDPNMSVDELVKSYISKLGENIKVARFARMNVGESSGAAEDEE
jgi:elongation factor Ts